MKYEINEKNSRDGESEMTGAFVLASASPRRRELLGQIGAEVLVWPSEVEEVVTKADPEEVVLELAGQKAADIAAKCGEARIVLGADTVVVYGGHILGKPRDRAQAREMLEMLQGDVHRVYTGVCICCRDAEKGTERWLRFAQETEVEMYPMVRQEIEEYIATGEPMDKAGAYGIQGISAKFIRRISGDYNNVVGLPVSRIYQELRALGVEL